MRHQRPLYTIHLLVADPDGRPVTAPLYTPNDLELFWQMAELAPPGTWRIEPITN